MARRSVACRGILLTIIAISLIGLAFDPAVSFKGLFAMPSLSDANGHSLLFSPDIGGALQAAVLPSVLALVMTAVFDATGTIRAVAGQANLLDKEGQIINGGKALTTDSISSIFAGLVGASPAAVYIESAAGTAAGGKTGLTAIVVGLLFLLILFMSPLAYLVPAYATAPALMYVGLLMLSNVAKIDFNDFVDAMSGLVTAVFIVLTCNIVTGIMLGFGGLVIGRLFAGEWRKLNIGTVIIAVALVALRGRLGALILSGAAAMPRHVPSFRRISCLPPDKQRIVLKRCESHALFLTGLTFCFTLLTGHPVVIDSHMPAGRGYKESMEIFLLFSL